MRSLTVLCALCRTTVPEEVPVPQRPPGERPASQRMVGGMQFGAFGPGAPGYPQIVANIGLFPSLFGLAFVSRAAACPHPSPAPLLHVLAA